MNSVKEILHFLNELDFTDNINFDQPEKLRCVKRRLVSEFEDYNVGKLMNALINNHERSMLIMTTNLECRLEKTSSLTVNNFYLTNYEHFVENEKER